MGRITDLDSEGLPTREGIYLVNGVYESDEPEEIDVYHHPVKGLCCFSDDFQSPSVRTVTSEGELEDDCHVSVQNTGLEFISRIGNLKLNELN